MLKNLTQPIQFNWQAILWRLLLTLLLLITLAGPGLTIFRAMTSGPGARALPSLIQESGDEAPAMTSGDFAVP